MKKLVLAVFMLVFMASAIFAAELNLKVGYDTFGDIKNKADGGDTNNIMKSGFSAIGEVMIPILHLIRVGGGLEYQFDRELDVNDGAKIGFMPVYATVQVNPIPIILSGLYAKGNIGYNVLFNNDSDLVDSSKGGAYWALGIGYDLPFGLMVEAMYGVYYGTIDYKAGGSSDISYSKLGINAGIRFHL